ncbi:MAG TPA: universal stress protein, partial [Rhodopila sp.]|nr:universal stress protein [Rhodopila sp.]
GEDKMALKNLLVHLDLAEGCERRLQAATDMASRHAARLTGLFVKDQSVAQINRAKAAELGLSPARELAMIDRMFDDLAESGAEKTRERFEKAAAAAGVHAEWRCEAGRADEIVPRHARYADLCIIGQWKPEMEELPYLPKLVEQALFLSGRPVLIVPSAAGPTQLGRHVLVGWNASRGSARAVNDAMALLVAADHVTVVVVDPQQGDDAHGEDPGTDIGHYLALHGAKVTTTSIASHARGIGQTIVEHAAKIGADMVVTGCYGHSRWREFILGGTTRTLLRQSSIPVMMSY